ncbi:MAG: type IV pilus biogenesis/stability protein PilW [Xanthomonadales bacterium]
MNGMARRTVFTLLAMLLLAACASSPERSDTDSRKAAETNTALGRQYLDRGQYEISLEKLKRAVAYDETYAPAHTMLGVLYETIGDREMAETEYREAVRHDPKDGSVNNNLGAFLCGIGKREEADRFFRTAIADPFYQTPEIALSNAGSCALARGDLDTAETYLRQSLKRNPRMAAALLPMAEVSYRKGDYLKARAFLQRYEAVAARTRESLSLGVRVETQLGDEASAEQYRRALREQYPGAMETGG